MEGKSKCYCSEEDKVKTNKIEIKIEIKYQ